MSTINVTNLSGRNGSPNLPDGAVITGVATATTFDGSLKTTGTPTLGLGVTINSSGLVVSGVATAGVGSFTTVYGDGSNLTGVGESIAPWHYNPDINDTSVAVGTGIGITFNKKVLAGSGTATLKIVNAGAAGTTIQSWGVSSATYNVTQFTLDALVSDLIINQTYQIDIPSGFIVDSSDSDYVGTAYTFTVEPAFNKLWTFGRNDYGQLGLGDVGTNYSSPKQIPSTTAWKAGWGQISQDDAYNGAAIKEDGTLFTWGRNSYGVMGINTPSSNPTSAYSSPVQVPGTTWSQISLGNGLAHAIKTDGTLWAWGGGGTGALGQNDLVARSSPIQIPGTTWSYVINNGSGALATKTNGRLCAWGFGATGRFGLSAAADASSPTQIPGTTWTNKISFRNIGGFAIKTNGTLWAWGDNEEGQLAQNNTTKRSSPVQIGSDTTWALLTGGYRGGLATKTDGTLWAWGRNDNGKLGQNQGPGQLADVSSPVQIPGTTWPTSDNNHLNGSMTSSHAIKTDGTLWGWGNNQYGQLGQGDVSILSSPVQIGSLTDWDQVRSFSVHATMAVQKDTTP